MPIPIRFGPSVDFWTVREFLRASGYTSEAVRKAFGAEHLYDCALGQHRPEAPEHAVDGFDLCLRLFLEGRAVEAWEIREMAGERVMDALLSLGLIATEEDGRLVSAPVSLYPVRDIFVISDRWTNLDGTKREPADDMVYAALVRNTDSFLNLIPTTPCERMLDLCSGTGIAALLGARDFARTAWAYDLTERSTLFAGFNARLNAMLNVVPRQGDAYEPSEGMMFDRIVAHPPYVPVLEHKWIYHSGGADGEQITRKVIEGLPRHLVPGGTCYILAAATDRAEGALEQRIRGMLGEAQGEFDVSVIVKNAMEPAVFAVRQVLFGFSQQKDLRRWHQTFQQLKVTAVTYGPILIQRRATNRKVFTLRRQTGPRTGADEIHWMHGWETRVAEGNLAADLLPASFMSSPDSRLSIEHTLDGEDWAAQRYVLAIDYPFAMDCENNPFLALLAARFQKPATGAAMFQTLKLEGVLSPDTPPEEYAEALAALVSGGFLETSICPLPSGEASPRIAGVEGAE